MPRVPRYTEEDVRAAVAESPSLTGALRRLGLRPAGGDHQTLRKLIERYGISTDHEQLMADVNSMSFLAVGRKYGVSDGAIRKWIRCHEYEQERAPLDSEEGRPDTAAA
jgi:hypothetical protein